MVFDQQTQRQVVPCQIGGVLQNLVGVDFVNHIGNQNDQRSLGAFLFQIQKCFVVPRFNVSRVLIEARVQQPINMLDAAFGRCETMDFIAEVQ